MTKTMTVVDNPAIETIFDLFAIFVTDFSLLLLLFISLMGRIFAKLSGPINWRIPVGLQDNVTIDVESSNSGM